MTRNELYKLYHKYSSIQDFNHFYIAGFVDAFLKFQPLTDTYENKEQEMYNWGYRDGQDPT